MSGQEHQQALDEFVSAFNRGDLSAATALLTEDFFGYVPQPGEQTAPEAFWEIGAELRRAFPDLQIVLEDVTAEGDELRGRMTLSGTFTGSLWGAPPTGGPTTVTATAVARFEQGRLALRWEGPALVSVLRELHLAPPPEKAHLKPAYPVRLPEIVQRLAFNSARLQEKACSHLDQIKVTEPSIHYCAQCAETGDEYPALRMCLICGFVGCCDLSVNKHMKKHWEETGHPLMRSIEPGEAWLWCYPDAAFFSSRHLRAGGSPGATG